MHAEKTLVGGIQKSYTLSDCR